MRGILKTFSKSLLLALVWLLTPDISALDSILKHAPKVDIRSPAAGSVFKSGVPIRLAAETADADGRVVSVEFFANGKSIGKGSPPLELVALPFPVFSFLWTDAPAGEITLSARATDNDGASSDSVPLVINVKDAPPPALVKLIQPANGAEFESGDEVQVLAQTGFASFKSVEFFANEVSLGFGEPLPTVAPFGMYRIFWRTGAPGTYKVTAKGTDYQDVVTTSEGVKISIKEAAEPPPVVNLTQPPNLTMVDVGATLELMAETGLSSIEKLEFFANGEWLGDGVAVPTFAPGGLYQYVWKTSKVGEFKITAKATSPNGKTAFSHPRLVYVEPVDLSVEIVSPKEGQELTALDDFRVLASANKSVVEMELFADGASLGKGEGYPRDRDEPRRLFQWVWSSVPAGRHVLMVTAATQAGLTAKSEPVRVTAAVEEIPLSARITSPQGGAFFNFGDSVRIGVHTGIRPAAKVEIFANGLSLGFAQDSQLGEIGGYYSFNWEQPTPGAYLLKAKAVDQDGSFVLSEAVSIKVGVRGVITLASPANGEVFKQGAPILMGASVSMTGLPKFDSVEFLADGIVVGKGVQISANPGLGGFYQFEWTDAPVGPHAVSARLGGADANYSSSTAKIEVVAGSPRFTVEITAPATGSVFAQGADIRFTVETSVQNAAVEFFANEQSLGLAEALPVIQRLGAPGAYELIWKAPSAGDYSITARAVLGDLKASSKPLKILVRRPPPGLLSVSRELPDGFVPGSIFTVSLAVKASDAVAAYAVEEQPPEGWVVSEISDEGVFDSPRGKVKFGPFTDGVGRILSYKLMAPVDAVSAGFRGKASANGLEVAITGDQIVQATASRHPADHPGLDDRINLNEVTAYAAAWKTGREWAVGPNPIPLSFVTRAGLLWKRGESYQYAPDLGEAPACWIPFDDRIPPQIRDGLKAQSVSSSVRSVEPDGSGGYRVHLTVQPAAGTSVFAVEEKIPSDAVVDEINEEGFFSQQDATIRWGLFYGDAPRLLRYRVASPEDFDPGAITLSTSFDGSWRKIQDEEVDPPSPTKPIGAHRQDGHVNLRLEPAGRPAVLEFSPSLENPAWIPVREVPAGVITQDLPVEGSNGVNGFYRLRFR